MQINIFLLLLLFYFKKKYIIYLFYYVLLARFLKIYHHARRSIRRNPVKGTDYIFHEEVGTVVIFVLKIEDR